jgi:hypothetical protein
MPRPSEERGGGAAFLYIEQEQGDGADREGAGGGECYLKKKKLNHGDAETQRPERELISFQIK